MGYPPRFFVEGYWYHVTTKGQRDEPLFFSPDDRVEYMDILQDEFRRRSGFLGSVCLMTNHFHLLVQMGETPLDRIFQPAHMKYAKYFNNKRDTNGHVFQSRPTMKIVLDDAYLQAVVGYIHRNPVEAGIIEDARDYEWSSWPMFYGSVPEWLDEYTWKDPPIFEDSSRRERFETCLEDESYELTGEPYVGSEEEWMEFEKRQKGREGGKYKERRGRRSKEEIIETICANSDFTPEDLRDSSRKSDVSSLRHKAMYEMYEDGWGPSEIGRFFNRTRSAVVHACRKFRDE